MIKKGSAMFILLFLFWLMMMGSITTEIVTFGLLISAAIYFLMYKLFGITPKKELRYISLAWYAPMFLFLMLWEVIKANLAVLKVIFSGTKHPESVIVTRRFPLVTEFARNVFANSITLTPGTISVEVTGDVFTVHCLESSFADGLDDWVVLKFLMKIERKLGYDSRNA